MRMILRHWSPHIESNILVDTGMMLSQQMTEYGISLAHEKTEMFILTKESIPTVLPIQVDEIMALSKPALKEHRHHDT